MIKALFCTLPFYVCLIWFVVFALGFAKAERSKRVLTGFLLVATVLYLCHAYYFLEGMSVAMDGLWVLCSLSVYPLYYVYICQITSDENIVGTLKRVWLSFVPAFFASACIWLGFVQIGEMLHKGIMTIQILTVCYYGSKRLRAFDRKLMNVYSDTEPMETRPIHTLLICLLATSLCSSIFNLIGKQYFRESGWLIVVPSLLFGTMLFGLSYVGYTRKYDVGQLTDDMREDTAPPTPLSPEVETEESPDKIGIALQRLMTEERIYLRPDLKIGELALQAGTNRTYLSNYINKELGTTFSDYINRQRIEYAKRLMLEGHVEMDQIALMCGFSTPTSFVRNFKKYEGVSVEDWRKKTS